jgi:serine/threonine protein kinase
MAPGAEMEDPQGVVSLRRALGGAFDLKRVLGQGSMATVYLAREVELDRLVAIKVLLPAAVQDGTARRRFEREARAAASLSHPKIVHVYRYGILPDGTPYLVMEYVRGRTIADLLEAQVQLSLEAARRILIDVASALEAAHARGIVHRDLRPANVLWHEGRDEALLSDFGIAALLETTGREGTKLTDRGALLGDPRYVSPEQRENEPVTELSDVYSFGVLGYELVAGVGPLDSTPATGRPDGARPSSPRDLRELRPDVDPEIASLLRRCLNREPTHRPSTADILRTLVGDRRRGHSTGGDSPWTKFVRKRLPHAVAGAAVVCWTLVEGSSTLIQNAYLPPVAFSLALVFSVSAVAATGVIAWYHGERGVQEPTTVEYALLSGIALAWIATSVIMIF